MQRRHAAGSVFDHRAASANGVDHDKLAGVRTREAAVDLALKWDVLAVCAVFAFVGAVLLGAF